MAFLDDKAEYLDILQNIEHGLKVQYDRNTDLTDTICAFGLEQAKIATKKEFGYAKNETLSAMQDIQPIIQGCVEVGLEHIDKVEGLTLKKYISLLEKIRKSVKNHSRYGHRGYYEFIQGFV